MKERKCSVEDRGVLPFRIVAIVQEKERLRPFLELAGGYPEVGFGLMLRDPEHRRDSVLGLAREALALIVPANVFLISNGCEVEGIEWRHLTGAELNAGLSGNAHPLRSFGCSVHSPADVLLAEKLEPDYLLLSPIYPTTSKPATSGIGIEALRECAKRTSIPIIALGGITTVGRARDCLDAGAFGVAGITLLDPERKTVLRQIVDLLHS